MTAPRSVVSSFHLPSLAAFAAHAPHIPVGFTYPEDRYGVSKRPALRPAIRLGTLALRRTVVARVPAGHSLRIGDRVRIVPNHSCVVSNLADDLLLVDGRRVVQPIVVAARGRNR